MFMRSMHVSTASPCIVNVDNMEENIDSLKVDDGQLFYYSTLEFKDSFTKLLSRKIKSLATINVKTSFKSIASESG